MSPSPRENLLADLVAFDGQRASAAWSGRPPEERRALTANADLLHDVYFRALPQVPISRSPVTGAAITKRMDVVGLDGPWWALGAYDDPPAGDPHVITYQGAIKLAKWARDAAGGAEIRPGPEVPYVIPRLLALGGVRCVITSARILRQNAEVFFMTYFAEPRIPAAQSHQMWLRDTFYYLDPQGFERWDMKNDAWDFDLAPWIARGKVLWTPPGDPAGALTGEGACPYLDLPGLRNPRSVKGGKVSELPPPDGVPIDFFD